MDKILITGGNGFIGKHLAQELIRLGYKVGILSRTKAVDTVFNYYLWDPYRKIIDMDALTDVRYIIHLAGANISGNRWTKKYKEQIIKSRVETTRFLFELIQKNNIQLKAFVCASAIGYYGNSNSYDKEISEDFPPGNDFLAETCKLWELATNSFKELGIRTVNIRTGVVLSSEGGALQKLLVPVRFGLAAAIGSGKQFLPWIHINDMCGIYIKAIKDVEMSGPYNAVAPEHITNRDFTNKLAKVYNRPVWLPNIPSVVLNVVLGEMAQILISGNKISSGKIQNQGYIFQYPRLTEALVHLLK